MSRSRFDETVAGQKVLADADVVFNVKRQGLSHASSVRNTNTRRNRAGDDNQGFEQRQFEIYRNWFMDIMVNLFDFKNAPISLNKRLLLSRLYAFTGYTAIGVNAAGNLVVMPQIQFNWAQQNFWGDGQAGFDSSLETTNGGVFLSTNAFGETLKQITHGDPTNGDFVIAQSTANWSGAPTNMWSLVDFYARELAQIRALSRFNRNAQRTPFVAFDSTGSLNAMNFMAEVMSGRNVVQVNKNYDLNNSFAKFDLNIPNLMPDLHDEENNVLSQFLTIIGINNVGVDKKERLVSAEAQGNNQLITASGNRLLVPLQDAFALLGTAHPEYADIEVVYNTGYINEIMQTMGINTNPGDMDETTGGLE